MGLQEGFDCAARAINTGLGFQLFSRREQVVRLIESQSRISEERAKKVKSRGGIYFDILEDFAVSQKIAYSFVRVAHFNLRDMGIMSS